MRLDLVLNFRLADLDVTRNKLVSRFSDPILLLIDHSLGLIYDWKKSCPCGICVPSNSTVSQSKKIKLNLFLHDDCVLVLQEGNSSFRF